MESDIDNWREGTVDSNGVSIHYYRTGDGTQPALLLIHGFTDNGLCWSRVAKRLEPHFDLVMVDCRNHGRSGHGVANMAAQAQDMTNLCAGLDLITTIVIGHSVGASVAAAFATSKASLVSKLILEDPPWTTGPAPRPASAKRRLAFRDQMVSMSSMTRAQIIEEGQRRHPSWHLEEFEPWADSNRQVNPDALALLELAPWQIAVESIQCPTLLLYAQAGADGIVTEEVALETVRLNPLFQTRSVPDSGHNLRRENFSGFIAAVENFLGLTHTT